MGYIERPCFEKKNFKYPEISSEAKTTWTHYLSKHKWNRQRYATFSKKSLTQPAPFQLGWRDVPGLFIPLCTVITITVFITLHHNQLLTYK
jgi:hypothetical protein